MSVRPRLGRLLASDGRCFDVAIDHGVFNTAEFLGGIEDMPRAVAAIRDAGPDAIQLTPGQAALLQDAPGRDKPALVLRVDVANVYGPVPPPELFCELIGDPVEVALRLDAACIVVFLLLVPGRTDLHRQCVVNLGRVKSACERYSLQLLDDTVSFARLRLARDDEGQLKIARTYTFEFSDTGNNRRNGAIVMMGGELQDLQLEPFRMQ